MSFEDDLRAIARDDADLSGILGQYQSANPLAGLKSKDDAFEFIKSNDLLLSTLDSRVNKGVESAIENFKNGKMNELWKEREEALRRELNPEESEAAIVAREFQEYKASVERKEKTEALKDKLTEKAKEMGFPDPLLIREFAALGENAEPFAEKYIELFSQKLTELHNDDVKGKHITKEPKLSDSIPADLDTKIREARAAGNSEQALKLQMMKQIKR